VAGLRFPPRLTIRLWHSFPPTDMGTYSSKDLAVVIPTKDRPESVRDLLRSLAGQSVRPGRILVVDSGEPVDAVVAEYAELLPLEYHRSPPGQIRQRKLGLSLLDESTPLVATIDDDLVFEPNAFAELLQALNSAGEDVGGVGFNHRNAPAHRYLRMGRLLFMSSRQPGVVTLSGYNTSIAQVTENLRTSWLGGGYTVWKLTVLRKYEQEEIRTRWAVGEDVRFSYRVGKSHPLIVACKAGFVEKRAPATALLPSQAYYRGVKAGAAFYYFVKTNPELSRLACIWMLLGRTCGAALIGLFRFEAWPLYYALGHAKVLAAIPGDILKLSDVRRLMEN